MQDRHRLQRSEPSKPVPSRQRHNHHHSMPHPTAPRLPIAIGGSSSRADDMSDDAAGGMGPREDTSVVPLQPGEVRIPKNVVPPPVIMGRWASVTQTGEMFPSTFPEDVAPAPPPHPLLISPGSRGVGGAAAAALGGGRDGEGCWAQAVAAVAADEGRKTSQSQAKFVDGSDAGGTNNDEDDDGVRHGEMERRLTDLLLDDGPSSAVAPPTGESSPSPLASPTTTTAAAAAGSQHRHSARSSPLPPSGEQSPSSAAVAPPPIISVRDLISKEGALQTTTSSLLLKRISDHRPRFLFPPPPPPSPTSSDWSYRVPYWQPEQQTAASSTADSIRMNAPHVLPSFPSVLLTSTPLLRRKMMRWYQIVELWCVERYLNVDGTTGPEVPDHERAIVAPPPRPPLFSEDVAPQLEPRRAATESPRTAPYTFDRWMCVAFQWWVRISQHFDELRGNSAKYAGFHHVSKSPPSMTWQPSHVLQMIA